MGKKLIEKGYVKIGTNNFKKISNNKYKNMFITLKENYIYEKNIYLSAGQRIYFC